MILRYVLDRLYKGDQGGPIDENSLSSRFPQCWLECLEGIIVGMTSVGSGSLLIILLLFIYPSINTKRLVGTDLTQAVPRVTLAAALGSLLFGHVEFGVTTSLVIGSVPAVLVGSFLSSSAPDRVIRPIITFVILASGLKYAGLSTSALGWALCAMLFAGALWWLEATRPWNRTDGTELPLEKVSEE